MNLYIVEKIDADYQVEADNFVIRDGCVLFVRADEDGVFQPRIALAPGQWKMVAHATHKEQPALPPPIDKTVN